MPLPIWEMLPPPRRVVDFSSGHFDHHTLLGKEATVPRTKPEPEAAPEDVVTDAWLALEELIEFCQAEQAKTDTDAKHRFGRCVTAASRTRYHVAKVAEELGLALEDS